MNALILRLKNSIDKQLLTKVDATLMGQHKFIPISVKDNFLFVAVAKSSDKEQISNVLKTKFDYSIKFMLVGDDDLRELLSGFIPDSNLPRPSESSMPQGSEHQSKLGEMLVSEGVLSDVQLKNALAESKRKNSPIGSTLYEMGLISLDQLKKPCILRLVMMLYPQNSFL
ncbi:hypothetical protein IJ596_07440, partial [bacterium]|nr:hypothetical protein [bacterium]